MCDIEFENTPGLPRATFNLKILLDPRMRQPIWKYSWTPACDSQFENTPGYLRETVAFQRVFQASARSFPYWSPSSVQQWKPWQQLKPCQQLLRRILNIMPIIFQSCTPPWNVESMSAWPPAFSSLSASLLRGSKWDFYSFNIWPAIMFNLFMITIFIVFVLFWI